MAISKVAAKPKRIQDHQVSLKVTVTHIAKSQYLLNHIITPNHCNF